MSTQTRDVIVAVVLDRSGSMSGTWSDAVGGLGQFVVDQQEQDGRAWLTLVAFDDKYDVVVDNEDIQNIVPNTFLNDVRPRGSTALLDAVGRTINKIDELRKHPFAPANVVFVVVTDGYENASREFTGEAVKNLIEARTEAGWEFAYFGANQDAWAVGGGYGITKSAPWQQTPEGTRQAFATASASLSTYRGGGDYVIDTDSED